MNTRLIQSALRLILALVFALSLAGISAQQARARGYFVSNLNDSGSGSLRQAITNANGYAGADTITFAVSGTITLGSLLPAISDDLSIDGIGQNVTISGNHLYRVFTINTGKVVSLTALTISNGYDNSVGGGGIFNQGGMLTVTNCTFSGNTAGNYGGAIVNDTAATLTVTGSTFTSNSAPNGGGIDNYDSTLTVTDSTFINNSGTYGGAIVTTDSATVTDSTFSGNSADYGGGIDNYGGTLIVANSTFSGNTAVQNGGGIFTSNAGVTEVTNSTFSGNGGNIDGGGIYVWSDGSLLLNNTILANSTAGGDCDDVGIFAGDLNNLIESNNGCGTPVYSADPMLGALANNGGPTKTFALQVGSPAIDAGNDATCAAGPVSNLDQRGEVRPYGAHCDIGSVEAKNVIGSLTVQSVGTYDGHILESGENTTAGGTLDSTSPTFYLGDDASDKQYRAILSFDTASLPNTAVITRVILKLRKQGLTGTDPFTSLGGLKVDIRKNYFGTGLGLVVSDFQATASRTGVGTFKSTPKNNWYFAVIGSVGYPSISLNGTTQFRLLFSTGDNDNGVADYMKFFSGNYSNAAARPTLVVEYYEP